MYYFVPDGIVGPKTNLALVNATPDPAPEFVGFTDDQIMTIQADVERAKDFLNTTIEMLALVSFLKKDPPDIKAIALKNIFHTDFTLDANSTAAVVGAAFKAVNAYAYEWLIECSQSSYNPLGPI